MERVIGLPWNPHSAARAGWKCALRATSASPQPLLEPQYPVGVDLVLERRLEPTAGRFQEPARVVIAVERVGAEPDKRDVR